MRKSNYDKYPATSVQGEIIKGWGNIIKFLKGKTVKKNILAIECYPGVHQEEIKMFIRQMSRLLKTVGK